MEVKSLSRIRLFANTPDCSPPGFSVFGILQARILEWVAISFSRGSSQSRDRTHVSHIAGRRFNLCTTRGHSNYGFIFFFKGSEKLVYLPAVTQPTREKSGMHTQG